MVRVRIFTPIPRQILSDLIKVAERVSDNSQQPDTVKMKQIEGEMKTIKENENTLNVSEGNLIIKFDIYKNILLNPSSHNDKAQDIYQQECENALKLLEELNKRPKTIK